MSTGVGQIDWADPVNRECDLAHGLVGFWLPLPGWNSGPRLPNLLALGDNGARAAHGTLTNGPTWTAGPNGFGALSFDGSNDYVQLSQAADLNFGTSDFLLEVSFRPTDATAADIVVGKHDGATPQWQFWSGAHRDGSGQSGALSFAGMASGGGKVGTASGGAAVLVSGQWAHVVVARVGTTLSIYLNGAFYHSATDTANYSHTDGVSIGRRNEPGFPNYFTGLVGHLRAHKGAAPSPASGYGQFARGFPDLLRRVPNRAWSFGTTSPPPPPPTGAFVPLISGLGW